MSTLELVKHYLETLKANDNNVEAAVVITPSGLPIAATSMQPLDSTVISAMAAGVLVMAERFATDLARGGLTKVVVEGDGGSLIITPCTGDVYLAALTRESKRLGFTLLMLKYLAERLSPLLKF